MKQFNILHLADLHIDITEDPAKDRVREELIKDVKSISECNSLELNAIVVTGDVVNKGGNKESYNKATVFLEKLTSNIGLTLREVAIVPGNHDIPRRDIIINFLKNARDDTFFDQNKSLEHWETLGSRFYNYNNFISKCNQGEDYISSIYGGGIKRIKTSVGDINLILLNSAWSTYGDDDEGNLFICRWQTEDIRKIYHTLPKADITLALCHHPFEWLRKPERGMLIDFLSTQNLLPVNAILHGHIHTGGIDVNISPDGSLLRLATGIGYEKQNEQFRGQPKLADCRYALYRFDLDKNCINVWLRVTRNGGEFVADTKLYKAGSENGSFTIPFKNIDYGKVDNLKKTEIIELDPVPIIPEWVGRKEELEKLLNPKWRVVAITGVGGQGKTALASEFLRRYARQENETESLFEIGIWVDCREIPDSLHTRVIQLLDRFSGGVESERLYKDEKIEDTAKRLLRHLQSRKSLIIFDNTDAYVKADSEGATREFKPFIDIVLNNEHQSLMIFTCRPPFNDPRGSFFHILLTGLTQDEGIEFFRKRSIQFTGNNAERYCRTLVQLTKGHPWWLGLIAGQVNSKQETLKNCIEKLSRGESTTTAATITDYFKGVWIQLNKQHQKLLRYLVEAPRPLTEDEICHAVNEFGPVKTRKEIHRLQRLGLLEQHEGSTMNNYQVHPLIREYIHDNFSRTLQRKYVSRVLCLFLPKGLVEVLFVNTSALDNLSINMSPTNLVDSIETCLNSRNEVQALELLERYKHELYDNGYHHQFRSLSCRLLDVIDWDETHITQRINGGNFLSQIVEQLALYGDVERSDQYIKKLETLVEHNSLPYAGFLSIVAFMAWRRGDFVLALKNVNDYFQLVRKLNSERSYHDVEYIKALALRDSGQYKEALKIFQQLLEKKVDAPNLGNTACCLIKLKRHAEAETLLQKSLILLLENNDYNSKTNLGYAYLWIADAMYEQKKYYEANAFLYLVKHHWSEYAPGLLYKVEESIANKFSEKERLYINLSEALLVKRQFLTNCNTDFISEKFIASTKETEFD